MLQRLLMYTYQATPSYTCVIGVHALVSAYAHVYTCAGAHESTCMYVHTLVCGCASAVFLTTA